MGIVAIIQLLLTIVSFLMKKANETQMKELGKNELVKEQLEELAVRTGVAKSIADTFSKLSDTDVDDFLQKYYRNEGNQ